MARRHGIGPIRPLILTAAILAAGCTIEPRTDRPATGTGTGTEAPHKEVVEVPGVAPSPVYSPAIRSGDFIFLAGAVGSVPGGEFRLAEGGVGPETRQVLENLRHVIEAAGGTMDDMVKCTVFLADIEDYAAMNEVYVAFFPSGPPARSAFATGGLPFDARVEIECMAAAR
ncbi:MAG: RidA family protein [Gemmatimonadota bacterium]